MTKAIFSEVYNRGSAPQSFIDALVNWGRTAEEEIFAPNPNQDIYSSIRSTLVHEGRKRG